MTKVKGRERFDQNQRLLILAGRVLNKLPRSLLGLSLEIFKFTPGLLGFGIRYIFLYDLAKACGRVVAVYPGVYIQNIGELEIGDYVSIHQMCYLECAGGLIIGSNVSLSHSVSIITHEHDYLQTDVPIRDSPEIMKPVTVCDNVWIGAGAKILAGVSIGEGAVIGAGSVVTKSIPPNSVAVGIPAKVIKSRQ